MHRLRLSFIVSGLAAAVIFANLLDLGLSTISRNPFSTATGITTREGFMEKFQPDYASALQLVAQTAPSSKVYALFEPRSYGVSRNIQPDTLLDNFSHDVFLYKDPENIILAWRRENYTHVLVSKRGADLVLSERKYEKELLEKTIGLLKPVSMSPNGSYTLYEIILQ